MPPVKHQSDTVEPRLSGGRKLLVELGPLLVMLLGFFKAAQIGPYLDGMFNVTLFAQTGQEMFVAVAVFLPAFVMAFAYSVYAERRISPMLLVTGILVVVLGGLTLFLQNKTFIYLKPTLTYALFVLVLGGGQMVGRNFLKLIFDNAFSMPERAWVILTWRFVGCFAMMAVCNEIAWRTLTADCAPDMACAGEATWIKIKAFGFTGVYLLFMIAQLPFLMRHIQDPTDPGSRESVAKNNDSSKFGDTEDL